MMSATMFLGETSIVLDVSAATVVVATVLDFPR